MNILHWFHLNSLGHCDSGVAPAASRVDVPLVDEQPDDEGDGRDNKVDEWVVVVKLHQVHVDK